MRDVLLTCWLLAAAAAPTMAQDWTYARSERFEVYTTGGDRRAREALAAFERVHAFFADVLRLAPRTSTPTRVIVFSGSAEYAAYRPHGAAVAYYLPGLDRDYIVMRSFDADAHPLVVHEYVHLAIRHSETRYPAWLSEGFAEFFSTMQFEGDRVAVGIVPPGRVELLTDMGQPMPLEQFLAVTHGSREYSAGTHVGTFYSQSWALTHMILTDPRYHDGHGRFLDRMAAGTPAAAALADVYGRSVAEVERDLNAYIRGDRFGGFRARFTPPPPAPVATRPAGAFEGELMLADLVVNQGRTTDARAAFERIASQWPDALPVVEARARFELRAAGSDSALPHLRHAVALGSASPSVYRMLARLDPDGCGAVLERGLARAPDDPGLRIDEAICRMQGGQSGQALLALGRFRQVPESWAFQYFQTMAHAYLRLGEVDSGRNAARRAAEHATGEAESAYAARLLAAIDASAAGPAADGSWTLAPFVAPLDGFTVATGNPPG